MPRSTEELIKIYKIEKMKDNKKEAEKTLFEIISNYIPMIHHHINRIIITKPDKKSSKDDMEQEAAMALVQAVDTYDSSRDTSFCSYAYNKVFFAIIDWIASDRLIPIPRHKRRHMAKYFDIVFEYKREHNDAEPSEE